MKADCQTRCIATWISGFLDTPAPNGWRGVDGWQSACEHAHLPPRQVVARPPSSCPATQAGGVRASRALTDPLQLGDKVFGRR